MQTLRTSATLNKELLPGRSWAGAAVGDGDWDVVGATTETEVNSIKGAPQQQQQLIRISKNTHQEATTASAAVGYGIRAMGHGNGYWFWYLYSYWHRTQTHTWMNMCALLPVNVRICQMPRRSLCPERSPKLSSCSASLLLLFSLIAAFVVVDFVPLPLLLPLSLFRCCLCYLCCLCCCCCKSKSTGVRSKLCTIA